MSYSYQRESILNILHSTDNHYSVHEMHKELTKEIPRVSLMTVYRNLNKLVKEGTVFPFHIDNTLHFCGNTKLHFHMNCVNCGKIIDIFNKDIDGIILNQVKSEDFFPLSNGMVIKGFCGDCKVNNNKGEDKI